MKKPYEHIIFEVSERIAWIRFNRPDQLNAMNFKMMNEIIDAFPEVDRQQLRQLTRAAIKEAKSGDNRVEYRKLFQFLKALAE